MKKILSKIKISDLSLLLLFSFALTLVYNPKTLEARWLLYFSEFSLIKTSYFFTEILAIFLILSLTFTLLSFCPLLLKAFLIVTFFFSTIYLYALNKFGVIFDETIISNAMTSLGHLNEVVDWSLLFYFLFFAVLPIFLLFKIPTTKSKFKLHFIAFAACILLIFYAIFPRQIFNYSFTNYSPINYLGSSVKYFQRFHQNVKIAKNRHDLEYQFNYQKQLENLNVILILGESLRADHLWLNGYERQTTPNLSKLKNLINLTAQASFNTTSYSVTSIMSHRTKADFMEIPYEKSIVSVFKNLGFNTFWYSAQSSKEFGNGMLNIMAMESDHYFFRDHLALNNEKIYDAALLPELAKALKTSGNNFIVLHSFGSHIRFHERYPQEFAKFTPECFLSPDVCDKESLINSYDNSILYSDYFLNEVFSMLKNTNSLVIFVSDHGVFLGENGVYANGNLDQISSTIHKVPLMMFMSDNLLKNKFYQQKFSHAKRHLKSQNLSHDNVFDSLLDCAGVESTLLNRKLSICQ